MDISALLPPAFVVACGASQVHQRIIVESRCLFCSFCLLQGHGTSSCRNRKGKRPVVASSPAAPSGKISCGGVMLAGTSSTGPSNPSPPLPYTPPSRHPPGVCENAQATSVHPFLPTSGFFHP
ncbi:hypothetical protein CFOL_v3_20096 [Cephalotus follicularis]|uniref:Uncharacterized protein n=1 Tax=Cephalotus follicularis TaxID=3775 RepID=A0A1Q3C978_CEPFO|nr:hypothetical protein CFOL_v3_20096 [Cephalotus follicularis]